MSDDVADAARVIAARGGELGRPLHVLASTTSTNDDAKRGAKEGAAHGATWVAEVQTSGRGRQGRAWLAPAGESLLFSVVLRLACAASRLPPLALVAGLAVRDAIRRAAPGADVKLKWPNDVVVGASRRKVAGVLLETTLAGGVVDALVVGIGINVHTRVFPDSLADRATSVALLAGDATLPPRRAELLADTLMLLGRDLPLASARGLSSFHARLSEADALRGARVAGEHGERGHAEGIDADGRLLVRRDDGVLTRWSAGEVHLV